MEIQRQIVVMLDAYYPPVLLDLFHHKGVYDGSSFLRGGAEKFLALGKIKYRSVS